MTIGPEPITRIRCRSSRLGTADLVQEGPDHSPFEPPFRPPRVGDFFAVAERLAEVSSPARDAFVVFFSRAGFGGFSCADFALSPFAVFAAFVPLALLVLLAAFAPLAPLLAAAWASALARPPSAAASARTGDPSRPTISITAISALSPRRGPSLMMRVYPPG